MNDPPLAESVRAQMQRLRCDIDGDVEDMADSALAVVDWRQYVKTYPWVCLGAAAALGFVIVPKRSREIRLDFATLNELARTGHPVVTSAPVATHGVVDALLTTVATIVVGKATAWLGERAGHLLGMTGDPGTSRHDSH